MTLRNCIPVLILLLFGGCSQQQKPEHTGQVANSTPKSEQTGQWTAGTRKVEQSGQETGDTMTQRTIEQVLDANTEAWMKIPGVVGTGIGESGGKPCIKILASKMTEEIKTRIPKTVEGYAIEIDVTGEFQAR